MISIKHRLFPFCAAMLAVCRTVAAADAYYHLPVSSLTVTQGAWPSNTDSVDWRRWQKAPAMQPYAVLNGNGEAYLTGYSSLPWDAAEDRSRERTISLRVPENKEITGQLFVPKNDFSGMVQLAFKVSSSETKPEAKQKFLEAKESYYRQLLDRNIPGAAWFRHQADFAAKERGTNAQTTTGRQMRSNRLNESELENTFDLFTGGRALSENLQLDRVLPPTSAAGETVAVTNLGGITVQEMNWKPLLKDPKPELDPLAACIPADQHALLFPSFQAMTEMIDEADANGTPVLQLLEPRSEDADSRNRYQKQLCLGLSEISRLLGPRLVSSVAFTGSDPFLRVGTDVAVLFETANPQLLRTHIFAQQTAARAANTEAKPVNGDIEGVAYSGVVSPDRSVSSYVASVTNVVFVSNSLKQLENLVRAAQGKVPALRSQDEYVFFRQRYPRNDKSETAFLVLSDAAMGLIRHLTLTLSPIEAEREFSRYAAAA